MDDIDKLYETFSNEYLKKLVELMGETQKLDWETYIKMGIKAIIPLIKDRKWTENERKALEKAVDRLDEIGEISTSRIIDDILDSGGKWTDKLYETREFQKPCVIYDFLPGQKFIVECFGGGSGGSGGINVADLSEENG